MHLENALKEKILGRVVLVLIIIAFQMGGAVAGTRVFGCGQLIIAAYIFWSGYFPVDLPFYSEKEMKGMGAYITAAIAIGLGILCISYPLEVACSVGWEVDQCL